MRGPDAGDHVRVARRGDRGGARQLRPLLHRHLQPQRLHRLERQLHGAQDQAGPQRKVSTAVLQRNCGNESGTTGRQPEMDQLPSVFKSCLRVTLYC